MKIEDVANRLVTLCREGKFLEAVNELYATDIVSNEPEGSREQVTKGFDAVSRKTKDFMTSLEEMKHLEISEPLIADNFFSIAMKATAKLAGMPEAMPMDEICVYYVCDGKIQKEYFFHTVPPTA